MTFASGPAVSAQDWLTDLDEKLARAGDFHHVRSIGRVRKELTDEADLPARTGGDLGSRDREFYVYGITQSGDPRVCPSLRMAMELAAGYHLRRPLEVTRNFGSRTTRIVV